ncbi:APC family permease [Aeromicrobium ginsengisoli]|uniref:Amino acid permease n=1 Tax=Aeromicrobium ginsengisoli TaxID=363867 RepID=A0A5M4FGD7_9ACTN|nr:APC family permease [Aeromicrobium ginsengisoli]KAA1398220.1 amino acid permease [Aeromicrobium ginsengisoli]
MTAPLDRRLGLVGSVAVGMSAMIGAGLFVVFPPAVSAAGDGLLIALTIAAVVAACNAISSARLARRHAVAGGTYVYGREQLGPLWGYLAGWSFIAGKVASCAAMAFALGSYLWPDHARLGALAAVAVFTAVNLAGVEKSAAVSIPLVAGVVAIVVVAVVAMSSGGTAPSPDLPTSSGGVLEAAGLLFFAFAGYARLATLGEEVREPARTIPRAIAVTFVLVLGLYTAAALALLHVLGPAGLADSVRPFVSGVKAADADGLVPLVLVAAALAAGGALLSLMLGVSRTTLAMARDGHLPRGLAAVSVRTRVPHAAEIAVAVVVAALICFGDLVTSVAFSSFCVLIYYAIANASAWTLDRAAVPRLVAVLGLIGCTALALSLPASTILVGAIVVATGGALYALRRR